MKRVMVRYRVKPDRVLENERFVTRVFEELRKVQPAGLRYVSFKLEDGASFVHLVSFDGPGSNPLTGLTAFKAFTADIAARCSEPPVVTELEEIGSYRF